MPKPLLFLLWPFVLGQSLAIAASAPIDFLRYIFGADDLAIEQITWPSDDVWMIPGAKNAAALAEIARLEPKPAKNGIIWETIQNAHCIVDLRDGKVDPAANLDQIFFIHRQLAVRFILAALQQDKEHLEQLVTKVENVTFGRAKPASDGDMDVYSELIVRLPLLRLSKPAEDKVSRSVTYRVLIPPGGLQLRIVKRDSRWLIDTDKPLEVPLAFFFQ